MDYLMIVHNAIFLLPNGGFAAESAFVEHLWEMRAHSASLFDRLVVASPAMSETLYEVNKEQLRHVQPGEGLEFVPLHADQISARSFWTTSALRCWKTCWKLVDGAGIVHAGPSHDIWRPTMFMGLLAAILKNRPSICVVDIDNRESARMFYETGMWSRRSYILCKYVYDPLRAAQLRLAVRAGSLVLLKGAQMVRDFGKGRPNVRNFYDTVHSSSHVIAPERLEEKIVRLRDGTRPLRAVYFGRLVPYKGVDRAIRAVCLAAHSSGRALSLDIIGAGLQKAELVRLVTELGAGDLVQFRDPVPYGPALLELVSQFDVALATPLAQDTPRAAFDAMASGVPLLAFDIVYYRDLRDESGAVSVTPWADVDAFARELLALDQDRERLVRMAQSGVAFAQRNTQSVWVDRRWKWTLETLGIDPAAAGQPARSVA